MTSILDVRNRLKITKEFGTQTAYCGEDWDAMLSRLDDISALEGYSDLYNSWDEVLVNNQSVELNAINRLIRIDSKKLDKNFAAEMLEFIKSLPQECLDTWNAVGEEIDDEVHF